MVHNRTPDDDYGQDVKEARRLLALHESMHNGKIRDERGEAWYGSEDMREWDRAVTSNMGILLGRIMDYANAVRTERNRYLNLAYATPDELAIALTALERIALLSQRRMNSYYVSRAIEHWQEVQQVAADALAQVQRYQERDL